MIKIFNLPLTCNSFQPIINISTYGDSIMARSYIPSTDADFQVWLDNFSELITADPTAYGLSSADATALATLTTTYDNALAAAMNGSTRGPSTVNAKDVARTNAQARARQLATIIQANPAVSEEQKSDLGITVRKTTDLIIATFCVARSVTAAT